MFEEAILPVRPVAMAIRNKLVECGALRAMMSGSGPSVYGIFAEEAQATVALRALAQMDVRAFLAHPIHAIGNEMFH